MENNTKNQSLFSRSTWAAIAIIGVIGLVFLLRNHTTHVFSLIPYLILLACPFMHLFMHKNHGDHNNDGKGHSH